MMARLREDALAAWHAGVRAVEPEGAVERALAARPDLRPESAETLVVAAGKAAAGMMRGVLRARGSVARGIVLLPEGFDAGELPASVLLLRGGHPFPTESGVAATRRILDEAARLQAGQRLLLLLSGGASALLEAPAPGLGFEDLLASHRALVASGLPIDAINLLRGFLSAVKAGRLAAAAAPADVTTLAISDVAQDRPSVIGSGPTWTPRQSSRERRTEALAIARRHSLRLPEAAKRLLEKDSAEQDAVNHQLDYAVIACCADAVQAARAEFDSRGYLVPGAGDGELRDDSAAAATRLLAAIEDLSPMRGSRGAAAVLGGETTVALTGVSGRGGRNLDLAARVAIAIEGREGLVVVAAGTDGCDGSSRAAGAAVDGATARRAREAGRPLPAALAAFDTEAALDAAEGLVVTGPTGTNVGDLVVAVVATAAD